MSSIGKKLKALKIPKSRFLYVDFTVRVRLNEYWLDKTGGEQKISMLMGTTGTMWADDGITIETDYKAFALTIHDGELCFVVEADAGLIRLVVARYMEVVE